MAYMANELTYNDLILMQYSLQREVERLESECAILDRAPNLSWEEIGDLPYEMRQQAKTLGKAWLATQSPGMRDLRDRARTLWLKVIDMADAVYKKKNTNIEWEEWNVGHET